MCRELYCEVGEQVDVLYCKRFWFGHLSQSDKKAVTEAVVDD